MAYGIWAAIIFGAIALSAILVWINHARTTTHFQTTPLTCRCGYKAEHIWDLADHLEDK